MAPPAIFSSSDHCRNPSIILIEAAEITVAAALRERLAVLDDRLVDPLGEVARDDAGAPCEHPDCPHGQLAIARKPIGEAIDRKWLHGPVRREDEPTPIEHVVLL